ncbi:transcriptional regulator GutM [Tessaracoccus caeni]|uniref:transcriptional regulator GutM n=1 Tax=Tessaracoccus caeni TaxID=3031239 RepID=UPI0023DB31D0|nr:transcriptional regulator GutM [Tessaracoccus caeni]MDF1489317.1 transcriptional regulator GutM [Tessaracoccus caeni]
MPDWKFPAILIVAMLLGVLLTYFQQRAYVRELNRVLKDNSGEHLRLVSGRGRTWRGGAIVILVVDMMRREIVAASKLSGLSVFARFRLAPALLGPVEGAVERVKGKPSKAAVEMALAQTAPAKPLPKTKTSRVLRARRTPATS